MAVGKRDIEEHAQLKRIEKVQPKRGGQEANLNRLKHGIFANRFLNDEEKAIFNTLVEQLYKDFEFNKSSDFLQVELVAIYTLKLNRAQEEGNWDAAEKLDRMIRCHMKDLKTTKLAREGEAQKIAQLSPADWATALMEREATAKKKTDDRKKKKAAKPKKRKKNDG